MMNGSFEEPARDRPALFYKFEDAILKDSMENNALPCK